MGREKKVSQTDYCNSIHTIVIYYLFLLSYYIRSGPLCDTICHIDSFNQQSYIFSLNAYALRGCAIRKGEKIGTNFML